MFLKMLNEELDIKIFILYVLSKLPGPCEFESLYDIAYESGVSYFDYAQCLNDLIDNGNIIRDEDGIYITDMGRKNTEAVFRELPFSVRNKADRFIIPLSEKIQRMALITSDYEAADGGYVMHLGMNDGAGDIIKMELFVADEKQAKIIKKKFKRSAEKIYKDIVGLLS